MLMSTQTCVCSTVISVNFEDSCNGTTSEDDPETQSTCSLSSTSAPLDLPCPFPSSSSPYPLLSSSCPYPSSSSSPPLSLSAGPDLLQLPGSGSLEGFEQVSPVLGPRSECSGASSPDCEQERGESQKSLNHEDDENRLTSHVWSYKFTGKLASLVYLSKPILLTFVE